MGSGPPPEIELIRDHQGGSTTFRLRLDLNLTLTSEEYDDLQDHFDNGRLAEACDVIIAKQAWDTATEKFIKVAVNPAAFDVTPS